ncbi:MAG: SDR family oxidoreductase [Gammaproteobacteria bacterium]|nr:SDR family oxidoreductase [Gammaproteobacteria bacterium]
MDIEGKVVVVTGAARGLGRRFARRFAELGAAVAVCDLRACEETAALCRETGAAALAVQCDVADAGDTERMAAAVAARLGEAHVLVNNAAALGSLAFAPFDEIPEQDWDLAMRVNVKGAWLASRALVPHMRARGGGSIVNVSSLAAVYGMANGLHYTTSKAALIGLTRGLAREVGRYGVRVNAVAPAVVDTEGAREFFGARAGKVMDATLAMQALRRPLSEDDLFGTVLYLASDLSAHTTGQTIMVDGGSVFL